MDVTFVILVTGIILIIFESYNHLLQKLGKLVRVFQDVKTESGEKICDDNWNFVLDIDEELGTYWQCLRGQD